MNVFGALVVTSVMLGSNAETVVHKHVETLRQNVDSLASQPSTHQILRGSPKKQLDESSYRWAYEAAFEDESCGGDVILGSATPLNKCFTTYIGSNIDKPSGSRMYVCDGNTFTSRTFPNSESCEDSYDEYYMPVGCTAGGWTRRASAKHTADTQPHSIPKLLLQNSLQSADDPYAPYNDQQPTDDGAYGDDFWGTHPIGNSYSVSCTTEEEFTIPSAGGNLVFEHVYDAASCDDEAQLSAINYFRQYYCFQMSPTSSGEFFFPVLSIFSDTFCGSYFATEELPLQCEYTPYGENYQGSDLSDNLSSYWVQHFAPTPRPTTTPRPTASPSTASKRLYHHVTPATTSPGMTALLFFASLFGGLAVGVLFALCYYTLVSKNKDTHKAVLSSYCFGSRHASTKVSANDGFDTVEMGSTSNPMASKEGW